MVSEHYTRVDDPVAAILTGIGRGDDITIDDLAPVDEFHLGGATATAALVADLGLTADQRVLDIGCGIGGPARRMASVAGCRVLGVDLTPSFVETATTLSRLTGLAEHTEFVVGDATALELADSFDAATLIHVGMNIADKMSFFAAVAGRLEPGCRFGVYDMMAIGDPATIDYPMPFATRADQSFVESADVYRAALEAAGFTIESVTDRTQLSLDAAAAAGAAGPAPVSLGTLMGPDFVTMFANTRSAIQSGVIAPTQIIAVR